MTIGRSRARSLWFRLGDLQGPGMLAVSNKVHQPTGMLEDSYFWSSAIRLARTSRRRRTWSRSFWLFSPSSRYTDNSHIEAPYLWSTSTRKQGMWDAEAADEGRRNPEPLDISDLSIRRSSMTMR